jgi:hypothetical protein
MSLQASANRGLYGVQTPAQPLQQAFVSGFNWGAAGMDWDADLPVVLSRLWAVQSHLAQELCAHAMDGFAQARQQRALGHRPGRLVSREAGT